VLVEDPGQLPPWCASTVVVADDTAATVRVRTAGCGDAEALADRVDPGWCDTFARAVARRRTALGPRPSELPARCRLGDLVPLTDAGEVRRRWSVADGTVRIAIGLDTDGRVVLDLDRDGPHALIAGSTGSGKSELLQTLVVAAALQHPPEQLSFLLVDYKGGAAFADCAALPHTVGVVTDLDQRLTGRVLHSLDSEVHRRERLLAERGAADLQAYRRSDPQVPLARLVIIVDEFASLAEELGAFVAGLVRIARRGRSLGLHLILATQRPAGVVSPEIRANCALRICLRVTDAADSLDVVDTDAAAGISPATPGRAYLRRGGRARPLQVAGVSGPARASEPEVRVVLLDDTHVLPHQPGSGDTELHRAVALVRNAARQPGSNSPHRPWLPPLPARLDLAELPESTNGAAVVGRVDRPAEQAQPALTLDLCTGGTVVLTGRCGSGRSTAVHTIARAAATAAPADLHLYVIDAGEDATLAALRTLPHTGTVATAADGFEFTATLVQRLVSSPPTVRRLVVIDGWDQLVAASEEHDAGRTAERLLALAREARATRSTVVLAGGRATLAPRVTGLAADRFVLAMADAADCLAAGVDAAAVPTDAPPGRAIRVRDGAEVQFAVASSRCSSPPGDDQRANPALRLCPLPRQVALADLAVPTSAVCLGVGGDQATPISVDLTGSRTLLLVAGPPRSGRTTLLATVLAQSRTECVVVAPPRSPLVGQARRVGVPVLLPGAGPADLPSNGLALVDDVEQFVDSPLGDALERWLAADARRAAVVAGRTDALAVGYRGLLARLRAACCAVVLHPAPGDPAVIAVPVPGSRAARPPGRGVLVPAPAWRLGADPLAVQVACPDRDAG
jgi:S-DNA-T family DNA segregation ATPase FtsK/SpoIIIE